jgi:hypothetical protein
LSCLSFSRFGQNWTHHGHGDHGEGDFEPNFQRIPPILGKSLDYSSLPPASPVASPKPSNAEKATTQDPDTTKPTEPLNADTQSILDPTKKKNQDPMHLRQLQQLMMAITVNHPQAKNQRQEEI